MEQQLRFLAPARPLVERFGADFFRAVPPCPGVYLMHGAADKLLYVGKAMNLRARLNSYRYVKAGRAARKTVRLVHAVERIVWQKCETEEEALLRENELLRTQRPRFNRANTYPRAYLFVRAELRQRALSLALVEEPDEHCFGAFKAGVRSAFGALLRLCWTTLHQASYAVLPRPLFIERTPRELCLEADDSMSRALHTFLDGAHSDELLSFFGTPTETTLFHQHFREADLQIVDDFFRRGPERNRLLRERLGITERIIPRELLDDLLVRGRGALRQQSSSPDCPPAVSPTHAG